MDRSKIARALTALESSPYERRSGNRTRSLAGSEFVNERRIRSRKGARSYWYTDSDKEEKREYKHD